MINVGQKIPSDSLSASLKIVTQGKIFDLKMEDFFENQRVVLFGVPGAFTPTCSQTHVPGFLEHHAALTSAGIGRIACISTNDSYVLQAWAKDLNVVNKMDFISDGNTSWLTHLGLVFDCTGFHMGQRSQRFAMVVNKGIVEILKIDTSGACNLSAASSLLKEIQG
jgi:peroxiredoxin (alkyl hydroperoxide reductase subunit C)